MANVLHPNIVNLIGITMDEGLPVLVLPLLTNGSITDYMSEPSNYLDYRMATGFCLDISKGMEYMSFKGMLHRDLAARNCLLNSSLVAMISDFGLTKTVARDPNINQYISI